MKSKNIQQQAAQDKIQSSVSSQKGQKIILKTKNISHILNMEEVTHLICDCYLTTVYTTSGKAFIVAKLLKEFEVELNDFGFVRVNRNAIVNVLLVASYENGRKRVLALPNKTIICISRRGMARLKEVVELRL